MGKYSREKRVSTRVSGLELCLLEQSGLTNKNVVRYGIKKYMEERPYGNSHVIRTEIAFLRDKIEEYELLKQACELSIREKIKELHEIIEDERDVKYGSLVREMYDLYLRFIDDELFSDEFRSDINNFYTCDKYRGEIDHLAIVRGMSHDDVIKYFERYMDSILDESFVVDDVDVGVDGLSV